MGGDVHESVPAFGIMKDTAFSMGVIVIDLGVDIRMGAGYDTCAEADAFCEYKACTMRMPSGGE